ncbi:hypothetical protein [Rufibacter ruber]|uniref:hypothetical protein n=1 Tax=Rufibacter ruber TaxID=1783499 RepID=UPI00083315E3|nr:hypothetical protein [Rufibacter ruber]
MERHEALLFILEEPLFKKKEITSIKNFIEIVFYNGTIDCYCPYCRKSTVYKNINSFDKEISEYKQIIFNNSIVSYRNNQKRVDPLDEFIQPTIYQLDFACSRNDTHTLNIFYKVENKTITKVGQSPSLFDIQKGNISKYKKLLGDNYKDLYNALMFYSNKFGIAAFAHLRRIIENFFIDSAYNQRKLEPDWQENTYKDLRFKEKIGLLKDNLPSHLVNNPHIYSILSKGLHELDGDECLLYFNAVKECILLCQDEKLVEKEKAKREREVNSELARIQHHIKKT